MRGIITQTYKADWKHGRAGKYEIKRRLVSHVLTCDDPRLFESWANFERRKLYHPDPPDRLHASFSRLAADRQLLERIKELQQVPLRFDKIACRKYLQALADTDDLTTAKLNHMVTFSEALHDGPNYPTYSLVTSGRVQTIGATSLQSVPKRIRRFFYPSPGHVFLDFDYRSQESVIIACLSKDEKLAAAVKGDLYQAVVDRFPHLHLSRNEHAKPAVNARNYGGGQYVIAQKLFEVPDAYSPSSAMQEEGDRVKKYLDERFPVSTKWMAERAKEIGLCGEAYSESGFARFGILPKNARTDGVNHVIQGTGADILRHLLKVLPDQIAEIGRLLLPMHDGLLLEVRKGTEREAERVVKRVMMDAARTVLTDLELEAELTHGWRHKGDPAATSNVRQTTSKHRWNLDEARRRL